MTAEAAEVARKMASEGGLLGLAGGKEAGGGSSGLLGLALAGKGLPKTLNPKT